MDKNVLITIIGSLQAQLNVISSQLDFLTEQIALMNQRSFGRKTKQLDELHQMTLFEVFNEPEVLSVDSKEPEISEIIIPSHTRKKKTTREKNLEGLPVLLMSSGTVSLRLPWWLPSSSASMQTICLSTSSPAVTKIMV